MGLRNLGRYDLLQILIPYGNQKNEKLPKLHQLHPNNAKDAMAK